MTPSPTLPAAYTFVLRLRQEWSESGLRWRGWIEHLPSGEREAVQDWAGVEAFVGRFGVEAEGRGQRAESREQRSESGERAVSAVKGRRVEHEVGEGRDVVE